jgi:hypothetical protein
LFEVIGKFTTVVIGQDIQVVRSGDPLLNFVTKFSTIYKPESERWYVDRHPRAKERVTVDARYRAGPARGG